MSREPRNLEEGGKGTGEIELPVKPTEEKAVALVKKYRFKPFNGHTDKLGAPTIGKNGKVQKAGEVEYYLKMTHTGYDLMAIYRNGKGTARKLVKTLKTVPSGRPGSEKRAKGDNALLEQLKKAGLPILNG